MIEIIGGNWAAGETKTFHVNGEYLEILDCQYTCDVMLMNKVGAQLSIMKGCEASFFSRPKEGYNTVQITSQQAQYLRVFLGSGDAGTRRISSTVAVVDGGKARTLAGATGVAVGQTAPVAAKFSIAGVWNPVGSGRRVIIKRAFVSTLTAQVLYFGRIAVAPAGLAVPAPMLFNGAAYPGLAKSCGDTLADLSGLTVAGVFSQSVSPVQFALDEPIVVRPGFGFVFAAGSANTDVTVSIPFVEEVE